MSQMRAITIHKYGGSDVLTLEQIDRPSAAPDELLVHVRAIGINPIDWKLREGYAKERIPLSMPVILGTDVAGVIEDVGADVTDFTIGDEVIAMVGLTGAYAEYVTIKASLAATKPDALSYVEAASLPLATLTAWQGLFEHGGVQSGQTILIHAAAGGVGGFAVQLANNIGANVIGTASAGNTEYVRELGASRVVDYHEQAFEEQVENIDMVLDLVGVDYTERSLNVLAPGGVLVQLVPSTAAVADIAKAKGVDAIYMTARSDGTQLRDIAALFNGGKLRTTVASTFGITDIAAAHELSQKGRTRGKIVVEF